jgi:hypothetical protein
MSPRVFLPVAWTSIAALLMGVSISTYADNPPQTATALASSHLSAETSRTSGMAEYLRSYFANAKSSRSARQKAVTMSRAAIFG